MKGHAPQYSLVTDSNACCYETCVGNVIETWMVGANAEYYDYVNESENVALCDVFSLETGFLNDCSYASDWIYDLYLVPSHVLVHVLFLVLYLFPSLCLFLFLSYDFSFCPFHFC